jgi:hypothetical protein
MAIRRRRKMKVTTTPAARICKPTYPYVGIRQDPYSLVLFLKEGYGVLLDGTDRNGCVPGPQGIGNYSDASFTPYEGVVTLQN